MVLTGAPGRAVGTVARVQIAEQVRSLPDHEGIMKGFDAAIADFLADRPMVFDPCLPDILKQVLQALELPINLPFTRELWGYDLPEQLRKVGEPVLVVIGKKDLQIDWTIDGGALERAVGDKDAVVRLSGRRRPCAEARGDTSGEHHRTDGRGPLQRFRFAIGPRGEGCDPEMVGRSFLM